MLGDRVFDLSVDEDRDPVATGGTLVYEINYGNRSDETTTGTRLLFRLAPGTAFEAASDGGMLIGGRVEWDLGTLAGHEGGRRTVRVRVGAGQNDGAILHATRVEIDGQGDSGPIPYPDCLAALTEQTAIEVSGGARTLRLARGTMMGPCAGSLAVTTARRIGDRRRSASPSSSA